MHMKNTDTNTRTKKFNQTSFKNEQLKPLEETDSEIPCPEFLCFHIFVK